MSPPVHDEGRSGEELGHSSGLSSWLFFSFCSPIPWFITVSTEVAEQTRTAPSDHSGSKRRLLPFAEATRGGEHHCCQRIWAASSGTDAPGGCGMMRGG